MFKQIDNIKQNFSKKKEMVYIAISSILNLLVLVFTLTSLSQLALPNLDESYFSLYFGLSFIFLFLCRSLTLIYLGIYMKNKNALIKYSIFAFVYLVCAILVFVFPVQPVFYEPICAVYLITVAINRIFICFDSKRVSSYLFNGLIILSSLSFAIISLIYVGSDEQDIFIATMILVLTMMVVVSLIETLAISFSRIKLGGILKIMKKTYAFEILYGLVVMVVSFSFYFYVMEGTFANFGDALWYSFAVVTTIGFGDFTVVSLGSRILSVILGIYSIIVVAMITSIIVNYYNEIKAKENDESKQENPEEIEHKEEDNK